jgi:hypothetical protein
MRTATARRRKPPLPSSPATSGELATRVLRAVIETGDHIGSAYGGNYGYHRSHFILIDLPDALFRQLCQHGAESEDDEDNGDLEEQCEDEGAQCDDEGVDDDREPDERRLPTHRAANAAKLGLPLEHPSNDPETGKSGRWLLYPRGHAP